MLKVPKHWQRICSVDIGEQRGAVKMDVAVLIFRGPWGGQAIVVDDDGQAHGAYEVSSNIPIGAVVAYSVEQIADILLRYNYEETAEKEIERSLEILRAINFPVKAAAGQEPKILAGVAWAKYQAEEPIGRQTAS